MTYFWITRLCGLVRISRLCLPRRAVRNFLDYFQRMSKWQLKPIKFDSQSKQLKSIKFDRKWSMSNQSKLIEVIVEATEVNRRFTFYIKFFDWHPWLFDKLFHLWQTLILDFDKTCQSLASVKIWQQSWYFSMVRYILLRDLTGFHKFLSADVHSCIVTELFCNGITFVDFDKEMPNFLLMWKFNNMIRIF